jgi:iron-sulfur cluster repair protein YtfE (RIC family)
MAARQPEDAIELLKADHRKVKDLFQKYENTSNQKTRQQIAEQVFTELEVHAQLEETVFYPAFAQEADQEGKQLVEEACQEHQTVKDLIAELRDIDDHEEFAAKFHTLMENVEHHVQEEEHEMFPKAEEELAAQLEDLRDEIQELKKQLTR